MSVIVESRIIGTFLGYAPGVIHRLDDASEGEQVYVVPSVMWRSAATILKFQLATSGNAT
jgi:hypothetical protein